MLVWHKKLWLIDHGAALYFHHAWTRQDDPAQNPFKLIKDHVLLRFAAALTEVDAQLKSLLTADRLGVIVDLIPDDWFREDTGFESKAEQRAAYRRFLERRLDASDIFVGEAIRARSAHL
jgi:hypothetical protein